MIGAPMPPTGDSAPRSSATYQRRKFVSKGKSGVGSRLKHVKLATVQQALEDDSTAVESLKRDVANFQTLELETSRRYLVSLQKTYDKLKSEADVRELQQKVHHEELVTLDRLCTEARKNLTHPNAGIAQMQDEIAQEETAVRVAQEQKDVFQHMIKRLSDDMLAVRQTGFGIKDQLNTVEREIAACSLQLQTAKQESKHEEIKLHRLTQQVKARRKMQETRLAGIQKVIGERQSLVEKQEERMRMREAVMARSKFDLGAQEEQRLKRMHVIRKVYSSMLEKKIAAEEESLGALETTFQKIKIVTGLSDVDEIVQKFKDRTHKTAQLHAHAEDVRRRIDELREANAKAKEQLLSMRSSTEASAGKREIYKEMDTFNKGLAKALSQCEDAKNRAIRSNVTLEQLKLAVARFRSKIEGKFFATPTNRQLPEYLRELDTKLSVKMKAVSEALALEEGLASPGGGIAGLNNMTAAANATPASDASLKGGSEVLLPFGKLQSEKLQKMLYHKLMLTNPDQSPRNVRVRARPCLADLERYTQRKLMTVGLEDQDKFDDDHSEFAFPTQPGASSGANTGPSQTGASLANANGDDEQQPSSRELATAAKEDEIREPVVDRDTVKRLSDLIITREDPRKNKRNAKAKKTIEE